MTTLRTIRDLLTLHEAALRKSLASARERFPGLEIPDFEILSVKVDLQKRSVNVITSDIEVDEEKKTVRVSRTPGVDHVLGF